jgi:hypothetical protein
MKKPRIHFEKWRDAIAELVLGYRPSPLVSLHYLYNCITRYEEAHLAATGGVPAGYNLPEDLTTVFHKGMYCYIDAGCQAFSLGENLLDMFASTDLKNVTSEDIKLPYEAFYIALPEGTMRIWGGKRTGYHDVWGIYVFNTLSPSGGPSLAVFAWAGPNEYSVAVDDDACSYVTLSFAQMDRDGGLKAALKSLLGKHRAQTAPWMYETGSDLPEEARNLHGYSEVRSRDRFAAMAEAQGKGSYIPEGLPSRSMDAMRDEANHNSMLMMRIAINTILYLNSPRREVVEDAPSFAEMVAVETLSRREAEMAKRPAKLKNLVTKISKKGATRLHYVAPTLEADMAEPCDKKKRRRHWVRGYWNFYWCGKGRTRREPRWLMPRLRGEGDEPEETRHYEVQE